MYSETTHEVKHQVMKVCVKCWWFACNSCWNVANRHHTLTHGKRKESVAEKPVAAEELVAEEDPAYAEGADVYVDIGLDLDLE